MIICLILEPARHCRFCCCSHQGAAAHEQQQFVADPTVFPPAVSPLASKLRSIQDSVRVFWKRIEMDSRGRIEDNCHARGISYAGFILDSELRSRDVDSSWQLFMTCNLIWQKLNCLGLTLDLEVQDTWLDLRHDDLSVYILWDLGLTWYLSAPKVHWKERTGFAVILKRDLCWCSTSFVPVACW